MIEIHLYIGNVKTGIVVVQDAKYASMWRVRRADGSLTDMVNLTRAKDAALHFARPRGLGGKEIAHWHRRETSPNSVPAR